MFTVAVTRTRVQLVAKSKFPERLTSIIAARFILIKISTLLGTGICLLIDDFIGLQATLTLLVIPVVLSMVTLMPAFTFLACGEGEKRKATNADHLKPSTRVAGKI